MSQNKRRFELIVTLWEKLLRIRQLGTLFSISYPKSNKKSTTSHKNDAYQPNR